MDQTRPMTASCEEAFRQVMAHRTMLEVYLKALVHDPQLAEDTFSDVAMEIAHHWGNYDATRPFGPWARTVARRVAWDNLRKRGIRPVLLDPDVLESVALGIDAQGSEPKLEARLQALRGCTEKLPRTSRQLVQLRYFENRPYDEIARLMNRNLNALYVAYNRIHGALLECVRTSLESA